MSVEQGPQLMAIEPELSDIVSQEEHHRSLSERMRSSRAGIALTTLVVTVAGGAAAAEANTTVTEEEGTAVTTVSVGKSKSSAEDFASANIYGNLRTVSKAKIKKAKKHGDCEHFSAQEAIDAGIVTQGYNGSGSGFAAENRPTTLCDTNGDGKFDVRAECGNAAHETNHDTSEEAESTMWVKNLGHFKINIDARAKSKAMAECEVGGATAYAYASGRARSSATIKIKSKSQVKGKNIEKVIDKQTARAQAKALAKSTAKAEVMCEDTTTPPPPPPPPPPENAPPTADLVVPVHTVTEETDKIKCYVDDPDGLDDIKNVSMTESGTGSFVSGLQQGNDPGEYYRMFAGGPVEGEAEATCTATDYAGKQGSDTESWPVETVVTPMKASRGA